MDFFLLQRLEIKSGKNIQSEKIYNMLFQIGGKVVYLLFLLIALNGKATLTKDQNEDVSFAKASPSDTFSKRLTPGSECLEKFFDLLYRIPRVKDHKVTHQRVEYFYQNFLCVAKWIESDPKSARDFAEFFKSFVTFPVDENREKKLIEEVQSQLRGLRLIKDNSQEDSREYEEETQKKDQESMEVTRGEGRLFLNCLAYHFNASISFTLPKEIREPIVLRNFQLRWNSACLAMLSEKDTTLLKSIRKILKSDYKDVQQTISDMAKKFAPEIDFGVSANIVRKVTSLFGKVYMPEPKDSEIKTTRTQFDGVNVIVHEPLKPSSRRFPGLVFFHGGGWVFRDAELYISQTHYLAKKLKAVVVSVDYRKAPEFSYPFPVDDCFKVTRYFMKHALTFHVDSQRIGVIGDSAGGNMATSISLKMRDMNLQLPRTQVLIYPGLQALNFNLPSFQQNANMFGLTRKQSAFFKLIYMNKNVSYSQAMIEGRHVCEDIKSSVYASYLDLNSIPKQLRKGYVEQNNSCDPQIAESLKSSLINPYIFPLMASNLEKLPPALLVVNKFDPIRDDSFMYRARLKKAGVAVKLKFMKRGFHGTIDLLNYAKIANEALDITVKYLKKELRN